jgi:hypothetical protein
VTKPRHTEVGLGVAQEGGEKDFASEFGERDASLGADTEILLSELSRNFVRQSSRTAFRPILIRVSGEARRLSKAAAAVMILKIDATGNVAFKAQLLLTKSVLTGERAVWPSKEVMARMAPEVGS